MNPAAPGQSLPERARTPPPDSMQRLARGNFALGDTVATICRRTSNNHCVQQWRTTTILTIRDIWHDEDRLAGAPPVVAAD